MLFLVDVYDKDEADDLSEGEKEGAEWEWVNGLSTELRASY